MRKANKFLKRAVFPNSFNSACFFELGDCAFLWNNNLYFFPHPTMALQRSDVFHRWTESWMMYSRLLVTRTPYNLNLQLTRSNFHFPSDHLLYNFTLDSSNFFFISLEGSNYRESTVFRERGEYSTQIASWMV